MKFKLQNELNQLRNENQEAESTIQHNEDEIKALNSILKNKEDLIKE